MRAPALSPSGRRVTSDRVRAEAESLMAALTARADDGSLSADDVRAMWILIAGLRPQERGLVDTSAMFRVLLAAHALAAEGGMGHGEVIPPWIPEETKNLIERTLDSVGGGGGEG